MTFLSFPFLSFPFLSFPFLSIPFLSFNTWHVYDLDLEVRALFLPDSVGQGGHQGHPSIKGRGHRLPILPQEWQRSGAARGIGDTVAAIFGKHRLPQVHRVKEVRGK